MLHLQGITHQGITPKGVALLLNGIPGLRHVVYDVMSDVLTYIDFNTSGKESLGNGNYILGWCFLPSPNPNDILNTKYYLFHHHSRHDAPAVRPEDRALPVDGAALVQPPGARHQTVPGRRMALPRLCALLRSRGPRRPPQPPHAAPQLQGPAHRSGMEIQDIDLLSNLQFAFICRRLWTSSP